MSDSENERLGMRTIVGKTPCRTAPRMLKMSPASQMMTNCSDNASAELFLKFSIICGEKTTIQHAIDMALSSVS